MIRLLACHIDVELAAVLFLWVLTSGTVRSRNKNICKFTSLQYHMANSEQYRNMLVNPKAAFILGQLCLPFAQRKLAVLKLDKVLTGQIDISSFNPDCVYIP